jgi:predicted Zn-dependent protease with MMP-like domain
MPSNSQVNELIQEQLRAQPEVVRAICEDLIVKARNFPERALETHLDTLVKRAVKHGEDKV